MGVREPAEIVFRNTAIHTADPQRPWAEALAVAAGRIACVGDQADVDHWIGPATELFDLPGKLVLPGFRDSHIHPLAGSFNLLECRLVGPADAASYLTQIRAYGRANGDQPFLRGGGWQPDAFSSHGPDRKALDAVVSDRPALLKSLDGHSAWVNSRALEMAGIGKGSPDPPGGLIVRDPVTGEPTGTLREWSAMDLVEARLPKPAVRDLVTAGWAFLERAARLGIVSVHEAMAGEAELAAYRELERSGELTLRVQAAMLCEPPGGEEAVHRLVRMQREFRGRLLAPQAVKIFLDGVVEGHTARLLFPYADRPGFRGELLWTPADLDRTVRALDRAGLQIHFHAIGDGAVRLALDTLEKNLKTGGRRNGRHLIAHCDLVDAADIPRFGTLGVTAVLQPAWFYREANFDRTALPFLGRQRAYGLYRMRTLLAAGGAVACGSDWPFSGELNTFNPLDSIQVGVTRAGLDADPEQPYLPEERLELSTLIDGFTMAGARADFQEAITGSLTAGKSADLAVLDRNPFHLPAEEISRARVLLTLFAGRTVFRADSL
ncbi:MAG: amidohydrolase [Deltaproteobacteria bacterium]|nr:amidohydrolase [Deltaproteobacteria bacterium]